MELSSKIIKPTTVSGTCFSVDAQNLSCKSHSLDVHDQFLQQLLTKL